MAANLQQMGGGGPLRRPQAQQLSQLVYSQMVPHQIPPSPWHASVPLSIRHGNAMNIITNSFLAMPTAENSQVLSVGIAYERDAFTTSPDKSTYEARITSRVNELFKKRQANEATLQNGLTAQAAAQAQTQAHMMMNQNMQMRNMGQPLQHGFQQMVGQQMQNAHPNQQAQQHNIGVNTNGLPMNPNQQVMHMGTQMRPQMSIQASMANLSPQDRMKVNQLAIGKLNSLHETNRAQLRSMLQQRFGPQFMAQSHDQGENTDPLLFYFQSQILQSMAKGQAGANQTAMAIQHAPQRPMSQPVQQVPTGPNGEFGPFANVESIMNQQKAGYIAQEAGQMVVPASNGAGRNTTPQPMGSLPGSSQGVVQQTAMSHQLQPQFNHQPSQQLKMDQRAAQSQVQIRAHTQAKLHPQPGGLNGPAGASQSPAMNTLNAPVRKTPMPVGQTEGHPQMGPGNMPFGQQMMDPRFNPVAQRTPAAANSNGNRHLLQSIFAQMPNETKQQIMTMPQDKIPEMILRWNAAQTSGQITGRPQPQVGQLGPGNPVGQPMAQFAPGNINNGQQPNLGMGMNQQTQMMMQQHMNKLHNPNAPQLPLDRGTLMDNMNIPPRYMAQLRSSLQHIGPLPDFKKWGQLKQWVATQKSVPQPHIKNMLDFQNAQFQSYVKNNPSFAAASSQLPQSNVPQQPVLVHPSTIPKPNQPTPNVAGSTPNITISAQELQNAKNHERFKGLSDERIHHMLMQMKLRAFQQRALEQQRAMEQRAAGRMPVQQIQVSQPTQTSHTAAAVPPPQPANEAAAPQRQPNAGHEMNATSPATQVPNMKQPINNRPAQPVGATPMPKNGNKRPISDDVAEVPNSSSAATQRAQPPPGAPGGQSQLPNLGPEKIAAMNPEQRQKYEAMMKNRLSGSNTQMSEEMMRLQAIGREQFQAAAKEQLSDIPMSPEQLRETAQKIQTISGEMDKIKKILARWYTLTHDDTRARLFFKLRMRLVKQYVDGEKMTTLKDKFTMTLADLDGTRSLLESIAKDVAAHFPQNMRKNPSQQNATEPAPAQGAPAPSGMPTPQPAPLNAVNLEKQTQALNKMNQRSNSRAGQPPAAPTTAQPPFPFGAQSPDGQPTYAGKPTLTQDNLHLPPRKRPRIGTGPNPNGSISNASPQVPVRSSPDMNKRQPVAEARQAPEPPLFPCTDQYCEFQSIGFPTEEARRKHMDEEHFNPAENPLKFATDSLVELFRLDANGGKAKKSPIAGDNTQSPVDTSKQIQAQMSLKRPGSTMGSKASKLVKSEKTGTPKADSGAGTLDGPTPMAMATVATVPQMGVGEPMGTTIDPQELLSTVTGLEMGGNGTILDMALYRGAITPKDTPESSNGSGSEPNSDVSEGVGLSLTLDMGFDTWDPFASGLEIVNQDLGGADSVLRVPYPDFSWDDVNPDFDKPFTLDTSMFSMDTS